MFYMLCVLILLLYKQNIFIFIFRNSLSISLLQNLIEEITKAGNDTSLKSIVLYGNGPVFSAGHNLNELVSEHINYVLNFKYYDLYNLFFTYLMYNLRFYSTIYLKKM